MVLQPKISIIVTKGFGLRGLSVTLKKYLVPQSNRFKIDQRRNASF